MQPVVSWYDANAARLAPAYEAAAAAPLRPWLADLLPPAPAVVIDVGAGTGRDAAALAELGHEVLAVEPSAGMRAEAARRHPSARIRWLADTLPALAATTRAGVAADLVLLSAVWQHVAPADRPRAFRKLVGLLRPGGLLALTLRHGPDDGRGGHPVDEAGVEALARGQGLQVLRVTPRGPDGQGRAEVSWSAVVLRLPDDGTGALPLLRHLILADSKSSTYKLGLLRVLCRAADGAAGLAEEDGDEHVRLPLGLVALLWLRLYLPLARADLPQAPGNRRGAEGLGFAGPGWRALAAGAAAERDLRVGMSFAEAEARAVHAALREAAELVCRMPATYLAYPNGGPILEATRTRTRNRAPAGPLALDAATLWSFGSMRVPRALWTTLGRLAAWVEPALVAEWGRLMGGYAATQGRRLEPGAVAAALTWSDPTRDVALPRLRALTLLEEGASVHCVWSGRRLAADTLDVDHCLPWSLWPCGDLWNLLPASRTVNQQSKRDRLPSVEALRGAGERIAAWWEAAYLRAGDDVLPPRFVAEARASLPGLAADATAGVEEVRAAMALQRLRLRQAQGAPEWTWRA